MAQAATLQDNSLLPQPPGGNAAGAGLAIVVHAGLLVALTLSVDWRTHSPDVVSAELWSAVPQVAAPRAPEPVPVPAPAPPPPAPAPAPPPKPTQQQRDADIAVEREQQRKKAEEDRRKEQAELDRKKLEDDKKKREQAQKEKEQKEQKEQAVREAHAAEERLAQQREENLRRMMGQAGGSTSGGTGNAARDAAPSASYAGRVVAAVRRNIVFTGAVADEATTEIDVRTGAGGTIISARMTKSSGNKEWDEAVLRAIEKTGRLPADVDGRVPSSLLLIFRPRE